MIDDLSGRSAGTLSKTLPPEGAPPFNARHHGKMAARDIKVASSLTPNSLPQSCKKCSCCVRNLTLGQIANLATGAGRCVNRNAGSIILCAVEHTVLVFADCSWQADNKAGLFHLYIGLNRVYKESEDP